MREQAHPNRAGLSVLRGRMIGMRIGSTRKDLRTEIDAC